MSRPEFGNLDDVKLMKSRKTRKKINTFNLVDTIVQALKNGEETLEQLEYTLKNNPELYQKIKSQYEIRN